MIDHIGITVSDYEKSQAFYLAALAPLGYELLMEVTGAGPHAGFGEPGKPDFWIGPGERTAPKMHVAFRAEDRATVRAFHAATLAAGATDNGPPSLREIYHPSYYGAFVVDPTATTSRRSATIPSSRAEHGMLHFHQRLR
jgi:catechol 2,3-dioxygenase-like lactoylglutathione lyase family enzyme